MIVIKSEILAPINSIVCNVSKLHAEMLRTFQKKYRSSKVVTMTTAQSILFTTGQKRSARF